MVRWPMLARWPTGLLVGWSAGLLLRWSANPLAPFLSAHLATRAAHFQSRWVGTWETPLWAYIMNLHKER